MMKERILIVLLILITPQYVHATCSDHDNENNCDTESSCLWDGSTCIVATPCANDPGIDESACQDGTINGYYILENYSTCTCMKTATVSNGIGTQTCNLSTDGEAIEQNTCTYSVTSCNADYYKNGNSCTQCPYGTTSDADNTTGIGACYIRGGTNGTPLCDKDGQHCFYLPQNTDTD